MWIKLTRGNCFGLNFLEMEIDDAVIPKKIKQKFDSLKKYIEYLNNRINEREDWKKKYKNKYLNRIAKLERFFWNKK